MSAIAIVSGALEGLQLINALSVALQKASAAVVLAQTTGKPVDFTGILGDIDTDEAAVLAAIAAAKAAGK
jgi:hypothetical protein